MSVGLYLKNYMRTNGIKQSWLAEQLGVSDSTLSMQLSASDMKLSTYVSICNALNVDPNIFLDKCSKNIGTNPQN